MQRTAIRSMGIFTDQREASPKSIHFNLEVFTANRGEIVISAGLMPFQRAAQALFGVVNAVSQAADDRSVAVSRLIVDRADRQITGTGAVSEEHTARGRYDTAVVLCDDMVDHGDMRAVVQYDALLAVMDVKIVSHHVLSQNESVTKSLRRYVSQNVIVILIS